ncbi:hypothetical protein LTR86_010117 [Recurvomyces mirabilis]|nr:hypothetical protein LTR86_010117 [Recurvomyces mirabilis]
MEPPTGPASSRSWRQPRTPREPHTPRPYNAQLGHSSSKKWISPRLKANTNSNSKTHGSFDRSSRTLAKNYKSSIMADGNKSGNRSKNSQQVNPVSGHTQYNIEREKVCLKSDVWPEDFAVQQHRQDWVAMRRQQNFEASKRGRAERAEKRRLEIAIGETFPDPTPIRPLLDGRTMTGRFIHQKFIHRSIPAEDFSPILTLQTVFHPATEKWKPDVAPWPSLHESDYEGDSRPGGKQETVHGRFLPLPRVEDSRNNWQQRALAKQYRLDDRYTNMSFGVEHYNFLEEHGTWTNEFHFNPYMINWQEIFFRLYTVPDLEFEKYYPGPCLEEGDGKWVIDDDGMHALGGELLALLEEPGYYGPR